MMQNDTKEEIKLESTEPEDIKSSEEVVDENEAISFEEDCIGFEEEEE